ncbi:unnamed protein product [Diatraea saccharalis]|uniref:Uncharacterized protein n=1 Tax=Diatraea saccharalis TaxID=40085 RepID=A0A9N9WGJ7_9NEOP|nr:unnamed protein product [Diatraea saccharalis]
MIASNNVLLVKCIFISFFTISISVKTYQVRRVNESTYLVTSFPEFDYENFRLYQEYTLKPRYPPSTDKGKSSRSVYHNTKTVTIVGGTNENMKPKVPASVINEARDNYFKTFYATMRKSIQTNHHFITMTEATAEKKHNLTNFNQNLLTARKLASFLIGEVQNKPDLNINLYKERSKRKLWGRSDRFN